MGAASSIFAQQQIYVDPNMPDSLLTKDQAPIRIKLFQEQVADLTAKLGKLDTDSTKLTKELAETRAKLKNCNEHYYSLLKTTDQEIENFKQRLGKLEGKVREMQKLSDEALIEREADIKALEAELNALRKEKIALIPEFYNKILALAQDVKGLYRRRDAGIAAKKAAKKTYTVGTWAKDKDCLWNISGKDGIYNDAFQWSKIWQANTDQIRNPDIIYTGQVLNIPPVGPKTSDDMKAERKYFRKKAASAEKGDAPVEKKSGK